MAHILNVMYRLYEVYTDIFYLERMTDDYNYM